MRRQKDPNQGTEPSKSIGEATRQSVCPRRAIRSWTQPREEQVSLVERNGLVSDRGGPEGRRVGGIGSGAAAVHAEEDHGLEPGERVRQAEGVFLKGAIEVAELGSGASDVPMPVRRKRDPRCLSLEPGEGGIVGVNSNGGPPIGNRSRRASIDLELAKPGLEG